MLLTRRFPPTNRSGAERCPLEEGLPMAKRNHPPPGQEPGVPPAPEPTQPAPGPDVPPLPEPRPPPGEPLPKPGEPIPRRGRLPQAAHL